MIDLLHDLDELFSFWRKTVFHHSGRIILFPPFHQIVPFQDPQIFRKDFGTDARQGSLKFPEMAGTGGQRQQQVSTLFSLQDRYETVKRTVIGLSVKLSHSCPSHHAFSPLFLTVTVSTRVPSGRKHWIRSWSSCFSSTR